MITRSCPPRSTSVRCRSCRARCGSARAGEFTIATQNILRLFDTDDDPDIDDPDEDTVDPAVYAGRLAKLSLLVREDLGAPDILVVQEAENLRVLEDLAARILVDDPTLAYTAYLLEGNDIGGIDIGFLVLDTIDVGSVTQFGLDDTFVFNNTTFILNDRPPLVLQGSYVGHGAPFPLTVIGVHQRSLSGIEGSDGPRIREKRHQQALRLSQYIQSLQTADPAVRLVALGDFNAFEFSDGYVDVMGQVTGNLDPAGALVAGSDEVNPDLTNHTLNMDPAERYSFVFDGSAQSLDHAVTAVALDPFLRGAEHARGNADTPVAFDGDFTTSLHTSDHDGTVVFIMSDDDADGLPDDQDVCLGTAIPEDTVPSEGLGSQPLRTDRWRHDFDTVPPPGGAPRPDVHPRRHAGAARANRSSRASGSAGPRQEGLQRARRYGGLDREPAVVWSFVGAAVPGRPRAGTEARRYVLITAAASSPATSCGSRRSARDRPPAAES